MLRSLFHRKLDSEEKKIGESVDYLRHIVDVSPAAFLRFASIMPFANSRKVLPTEAWFVAQTVAAQKEDCGPCLQITLNLARQSGVDAALLQSTLDGKSEELSPEMDDVYRFSKSVVDQSNEADLIRESLRERYGDLGLIELAYAIASSRIPPTVKRALGYAQSCSIVSVKV